jgi:hypothetical protein
MDHFKIVGSSQDLRRMLFEQINRLNTHLTAEQGCEASAKDIQAELKELGVETAYACKWDGCYIFSLAGERRYLRQEVSFFKHPVWTNRYTRFALFCFLAIMPVSVIHQIVPSIWTATIGIFLCVAALVLSFIAYRTDKPEQEQTPC